MYAALTEAKQFDQVTRLGSAMQSGKLLGSKPTAISRRVGGAFALFGGYVTGLQVELLAPERIVQAWRAGSWKPGEYSIASFALLEAGAGTRLVFDHRGFPDGAAEHLAQGWHADYWVPLARYLARGAQ